MHMQIQFGSWWQRLRRGGVLLSPIEQSALAIFRETMPSNFHIAIDAQLKALNLAQRDVDWKGLRLYRMLSGEVSRGDLLPLPIRAGEAKLLSLSVNVPGRARPIQFAFWAVDRVLFGFDTDVSLEPYKSETRLVTEAVKHAWRSNFLPNSDL